MKTIVLSVFKAFGDYAANTTQLVGKALHRHERWGYQFFVVEFEARIPLSNRGKALLTIAKSRCVSGVISLGMASGKTGLCVESVARNQVDCPKYCPTESGTRVNLQRSLGERFLLDLDPWRIPVFTDRCREHSVPVMDVSTDAGGFCSNHLAYQARLAQFEIAQIPYVFIHTPCSREAIHPEKLSEFEVSGKVTMSVDQIITGLEILVANAAL